MLKVRKWAGGGGGASLFQVRAIDCIKCKSSLFRTRSPFVRLPPEQAYILNLSFKTDGILILAWSSGVLSDVHFRKQAASSSSSSSSIFFVFLCRSLAPAALPPISRKFLASYFAEACRNIAAFSVRRRGVHDYRHWLNARAKSYLILM